MGVRIRAQMGDREMTIERDDDPLWKLADWVWQLRREQPLHRVIDIVGERAEQADGDDYRFLALDLARLLREAGRNAEAIRTLDQVSDRYPDDVRPAISKAHIYLSALDQPEQALKWIDIALERARRTGFFGEKRWVTRLGSC